MEKKKSTPKSSTKKIRSPAKSAKKSATKGKAESTRQKYEYSKLEDLLKEEKQRVYVYALVLDASSPYYVDSAKKYLCTVKLIDDTLNPKSIIGGKSSFMSATLFAENKAEMPPLTKIGSILRIHRGDTKRYEKTYQLSADANIKAAWALFDPTESFVPVFHTGRTYTFIEDDKKRIRDLRKFGEKFFKDNDMTDASSIGAKKGEIDAVCLVLNRKNKDKNHDRITAFDGDSFLKLDIPKDLYTYIAPQDIVRVRGLVKKAGDFIINEYVNILKVDKAYSTAEELMKKIDKAKKSKEISEKLEMYVPVLDQPRVVSEVTDKKMKVTPLKDLFSLDASKLKEKKYRVNVNVLEIGPKDPKSWLVPVDAKVRKQYGLSESVTHYYKLQLFSKDAAVPEDHNIYTLYLCTVDGKGKEFLPAPSGKGKKGEKEPKELKKIYKVLTKPWVTLDVILEGVPVTGGTPIFFIVDTKLTL